MCKRLTTEEFIEKAKLVHSNKYDFSKMIYKSLSTPIIVIDENGFEHMIRPDSLLVGNKLNLKSVVNKTDFIINKFTIKHGDKYDYNKTLYIDSKNKVKIYCSMHGEFEQTIDNHLKGKGCPKCNGKNKTTEDIINEFSNIHGNQYDYSNVIYVKIKEKVNIICPIHGEFKQIVEEHLKGCGCPICKESSGEREIRLYLDFKNIKYIRQNRFTFCKNILPLPFDFYLSELNVCIEYNGEQHYKPFKYFGGEEKLKKTKKNDKIKIEYCKNNKIPLIIIKYDENVIDKLNLLLLN